MRLFNTFYIYKGIFSKKKGFREKNISFRDVLSDLNYAKGRIISGRNLKP